MMVRAGVAGWLVLLCGVSCGRGTHNPDAAVMNATAGAPATNHPSGQGGDDSSQGGNEPGPQATCEGSGPYCLLSCRSYEDATFAECVGGQYVCPEGSPTFESCPDDACIRRTDNCCSATGRRAVPDCTDDGTIGHCPEGYEVATGACLPQGVDIQDCFELQSGDACTDAELVCYTNKCGRNCFCENDEMGNLRWNCFALPC